MSILKVANIHFEATGTKRLDYLNDDIIRLNANGLRVPTGVSIDRPLGEQGLIRYNSETGTFEGHNATSWGAIGGAVDLSPPFIVANAAFVHANAAFASANNVAPQVQPAFDRANSAYNRANGAYDQANSAFTFANTKLAQTGGTVNGDLAITGNLIVSGATVEISTANVLLQDNIITINSDLPNNIPPIDDAGLEVNRGSSANVSIIWNENRDRWTFTNDGTTFDDIEGTSRMNTNPILNRAEYIQANNTINFNVAITSNGSDIAGGLSPFLLMGA